MIVFLELLVEPRYLFLQFQLLATKLLSSYLSVFVLDGHLFLLASLVSIGLHWQLILLSGVLQLDRLILKHVFTGRCKSGRIFNRWKGSSVLLVVRSGGWPLGGEDGTSTAGLDPISTSLGTHLLWHLLSRITLLFSLR